MVYVTPSFNLGGKVEVLACKPCETELEAEYEIALFLDMVAGTSIEGVDDPAALFSFTFTNVEVDDTTPRFLDHGTGVGGYL